MSSAAPPPAADFAQLLAESNLTGALKALDTAIAGAGDDLAAATARLAALHVNRGYCHARLSLARKALKDFDAAVAVAPRCVLAHYRRGQALQSLGRAGDAREAFARAAELAKADAATDFALVADIASALAALGGGGGGGGGGGDGSGGGGGTGGSTSAGGAALPPLNAEMDAAAAESSEDPAVAAGRSPRAGLAAAPTAAAGDGSAADTATSSSSGKAAASKKPAVTKGFFGKAKPAKPAASAQQPAGADGSGGGVDIDCAASHDAARAAVEAGLGGISLGGGGGGGKQQDESMRALHRGNVISLAVSQINAGRLKEALALLDGALAEAPSDVSARVARGTARALLRDLAGAVADFDAAIAAEPRFADAWKRRGQARAALGDADGALADLARAAELLLAIEGDAASAQSRAECHFERGVLRQKARDYRRAAGELARSTRLDASNAQAWNLLGLCRVSMGDIAEGVAAYGRAVALEPGMREAWLNVGQALKEEGSTRGAARALSRLTAADARREAPATARAAYRLLAQMRQVQGRHADAARLCDEALAAVPGDDMRLELTYVRAICRHALGDVRAAAADYDAVFAMTPREGAGRAAAEEATGFIYLSFFQREMALYLARRIDRPVALFCPDRELSDVFKESWCKKGPITAELAHAYRHQPPLPPTPPSLADLPPPPPPAELAALTRAADAVGRLLQNRHQGFLRNGRQQRAAGYAAAELAQAVQRLVAARREGRPFRVPSAGASAPGHRSNGGSGADGGDASGTPSSTAAEQQQQQQHDFGWRDAMDVIVKWRQLAEPNDQVVWVDLLTRREFEAGFGSHTPMYSGQTKCVRYAMNFDRALALMKEVLLAEGRASDAAGRPVPLGSPAAREAVAGAATAWELYEAVGGVDCWVVVPLASLAAPGATLEGTRLTLVRVPGQPEAVEFSIRTPVTPPRWDAFAAELSAAWERVVAALAARDQPAAALAILQFCYYWYNFMPLARGTAAVGYTALLALFWAAGAPVTARIPRDYQVDWEAILSRSPDAFVARLKLWLLPDAVRTALGGPDTPDLTGGGGAGGAGGSGRHRRRDDSDSDDDGDGGATTAPPPPPPDSLPDAAALLSTLRRRIEALNGPDWPRLLL